MAGAPNPLPNLPAELQDAIIDYLHDDKSALTNCSLVCSSWLHSSRLHLFEKLSIKGEVEGKGFRNFLSFLATDAAAVVEYVKEVKYSVRARRGILSRDPSVRCIGPYDFALLYHHLPSMDVFEMESLSWDRDRVTGPNGEVVDPWPPARPFDRLSITRCVSESQIQQRLFRSIEIVSTLFPFFAPLRRLELFAMHTDYSLRNDIVAPAIPPHFQMRELCLHSTHLRSPGEHIDNIYASLSPHLRKLDIMCRSDDEAPMVGRIMRAIGKDLEELRLNLSELQATRSLNQAPPWAAFNLPIANVLQELHLHVFTSGAHIFGDIVFTHNGQWCLCSVAPILSCVSSPLRRIHVTLSMSGTTAQLRTHLATTMDWAALARELERFEDVERIVFELRQRRGYNLSGDAPSVIGALVEARLPSLSQRGLLEVCD